MTKDVIAMAREAGLFTHKEVQPEIIRFAALARNAAMEEAALMLEQQHTWISNVSAAVLTRNLKEPTT